MKLIIKDYLILLKEDGELDYLLGDLLLSMNQEILSKPQKGVRQFGVDVSSIGVDNEDGIKKVFLYVVKRGDFNRSNWDSGPQSIRQSINEILDSYISSFIPRRYSNLPKKIIICFNGDLKQDMNPIWSNFTDKYNEVQFDTWSSDKLSILIENFLFDENLFSKEIQSYIRKTLAFLDIIGYDLSDPYHLIDNILFSTNPKSTKDILKIFKLLKLCANLVFHRSIEANNLKPSYLISERILIKAWKFYSIQSNPKFKKFILKEYSDLYLNINPIFEKYFLKVEKNLYVKDSLIDYGVHSQELEYPLITFEQIGILSTIGLNSFYSYTFTRDIHYLRFASKVCEGIIALIKNNVSSEYVLYDGHINNIIPALTLMYLLRKKDHATEWITALFYHIINNFRLRKRFPLLLDSYEELVYAELGYTDFKTEGSTLIPILFDYLVILNDNDLYLKFSKEINETFQNLNLQIWFPEDNIENFIYDKNYQQSGLMRNDIRLHENFDDYKNEIIEDFKIEMEYSKISFIKNNYKVIGIISSRHYFQQPIPYYWRHLIK
jgi:hypothetical protein